MGPVKYVDFLSALFEVVSARQGRQDSESHAIQLVFVHKIPQALKISLGKIRIDNEIPGDAKPKFARNADGFYGLVDVGILVQRTEARASVRFQTEENIETLREWAPELQQVRILCYQIGAGLHQQQVLAFAGLEQGVA